MAYVYDEGGPAVAFVENQASVYVLTEYNGRQYDMPPTSTFIVDVATGAVVFDSYGTFEL